MIDKAIQIDIDTQALVQSACIKHESLLAKLNELVESINEKIKGLNHVLVCGNIELFRKNKLILTDLIETSKKELKTLADRCACKQEDINGLQSFFNSLNFHLKRYNPPLKEESADEIEEHKKQESNLCQTQQRFHEDEDFLQTLAQIKEQAHRRSKYGTQVYFAYAWPEVPYKAREAWLQDEFLPRLREHLNKAGIEAIWDKADNFSGSNLSAFMSQIVDKPNHILVFGTESLRSKLLQDAKAIAFEEKLLKLKWSWDLQDGRIDGEHTTIIPYVMTGTRETAFTENFIISNFQKLTIRTWRNGDYDNSFFKLISQLYGVEDVRKWLKQESAKLTSSSSQETLCSMNSTVPSSPLDSSQWESNQNSLNTNHDACNNQFLIPESIELIGRKKSLQTIKETLSNEESQKPYARIIVAGMGGFGKTDLVLYYAWQHRNDFPGGCFYINAYTKESLEASFQEIVDQLEIDKLTYKEKIKQFYSKQRPLGRILLIFDDVSDYGSLKPFLDSQGLSSKDLAVIFTARQRQNWRNSPILKLDEQEEEIQADGIARLIGHGCEEKIAVDIAKELGYVPLAITQAIGYMENNNSPPEAYLELLQTQNSRSELLEHPSQDDRLFNEDVAKQKVKKTWLLSLKAIENADPEKINDISSLLYTITFLYPDNLNKNIFSKNQQSLNKLKDYCLLLPVNSSTYKINRLFQEVIRESIEHRSYYAEKALALVNQKTFYSRKDQSPILQGILHCAFCEEIANNLGLKNQTASYAEMLYKIGIYHQEHYNTTKAIATFEKALSLIKLLDNNAQIKLKQQLAKAYVFNNNLMEAKKLYQDLNTAEIDNDILDYRIKIDQYFLLKKDKKFSEAGKQLESIISALEQAGNPLLLARCYHYLGIHYDQAAKGNESRIAKIESDFDKLSEWQKSNQKESTDQKKQEYLQQMEDCIKLSIENFQKALKIKLNGDDHHEIIRTTLALARVVNKRTKNDLYEIIIQQTFSLYPNCLSNLSPRNRYERLYYDVALVLTQLWSDYKFIFKNLDLYEATKNILKEEVKHIKNNFGANSEEYKIISSAYQSTQQTLLGFLKSKNNPQNNTLSVSKSQTGNKRPREDSESDQSNKRQRVY